ncbi:MAG: acetate/propionate family kinase [Gemmatimonadales bacterium]
MGRAGGASLNVLALNAGSGSLRYKLFARREGDGPTAESLLKAHAFDRVQGRATVEAAERAVTDCLSVGIDAIGCRVVHGGGRFVGPARVTPEVLAAIRDLSDLAPLHNPTDVAVIEAATRRAPGVPSVAVFDTAFHRTVPEVAWRYALPGEIGTDLRRYGFHGIAHRHVSGELFRLLGRAPSGTRVVSCHLGGGASVCALRDGRSVDTSMGLTPLEGLVMSTRCGDLDPGVVLQLFREGRTVDEVQELLYRRSGLLGLSGASGDLRDLEPAAAAGDPRAALALDIAAYRVRKYVGAYAAALGGIDALVLSGALAENWAPYRRRVLSGLEFLGVQLDEERNRAAGPDTPARIGPDDAPVSVWLIPADEERQIAREVFDLLCESAA